MTELNLTYNAMKMELTICPIDSSRLHNITEVVRCKDCKHMEVTPDCLRWCYVWNGINGMGDEGFCNYGERKDEC